MMLRKLVIAMGVGIAGIGAVAGGLWLYMGREGGTSLEQWIGSYLIGLIQTHIEPRLEWELLDYQAPLTVVIDRPRLTHEGVTLFEVERLTLGLAETPRAGQPVRIERLDFQTPRFTLKQTPDGSFAGWSRFLKDRDAAPAPRPVAAGEHETQYRFSDALRMRRLAVHDGQIVFEPASGSPMTLNGIELDLNTPPDESEPDWYRVNGVLARERLLEMRIDGRFNIDHGELVLERLDLNAALDESRYSAFPPPLQEFLRAYRLSGQLALQATGRTTLRDPSAAEITVNVELDDGFAVIHDQELHLDLLQVEASLRERIVDASFRGGVLGAALDCALRWPLDTDSAEAIGEGRLRITELPLTGVLPLLPKDWTAALASYRLRGVIDLELEASAPAADPWNAALRVAIQAREAAARLGDVDLTVAQAGLSMGLERRALHARIDARAFEGRVQLSGSISDILLPLQAEWTCQAEDVRIEQLVSLLPRDLRATLRPYGLRGRFSTDARGVTAFNDPYAGSLNADVSLAEAVVRLADTPIAVSSARARAELNDGALQVTGQTALWEGAATFDMRVADVHEIDRTEFSIQTEQLPIRRLFALLPAETRADLDAYALRGALAADLRGSIPAKDPIDAVVNGALTLSEFSGALPGGRLAASRVAARVDYERRAWSATIDAETLGGQVRAETSGPDLFAIGELPVALHAREVVLERLIALLPPETVETLKTYALRGLLTVDLRGTFAPDAPRDAEFTGTGTLREPRIRLDKINLPINGLDTQLSLKQGALDVVADVDGFGGRLRLKTILPIGGAPNAIDVNLNQVALEQLIRVAPAEWFESLSIRPSRGRVTGTVNGATAAGASLADATWKLDLTVDEGTFHAHGSPIAIPKLALSGSAGPNALDLKYQAEFRNGGSNGTVRRTSAGVFDLDVRLTEVETADLFKIVPPDSRGADPGPTGPISGRLRGRLDLDRLEASQGDVSLNWARARWRMSDGQLNLREVKVQSRVEQGAARVQLDATPYGGKLNVTGRMDLAGPRRFRLDWNLADIRLAGLSADLAGEQSDVSGLMNTSGWIEGSATRIPQGLRGRGELAIREGQLVRIPIISDLQRLVTRATSLIPTPRRGSGRPSDTAEAVFVLDHEGINIQRSDLRSQLIAARAEGRIYYDGRLDLRVNAGLIEGAESALGSLGGVLGRVSRQLENYTVRGTLAQPRVTLAPLGVRIGG